MSGPKQALAPRHAASILAHDEAAAEAVGASKFALTWPADPPPLVQTPLGHAVDRSSMLSSSEGESDLSEREISSNEKFPRAELSDDYDMSPNHRLKFQQQLASHCNDGNPDTPRLLRTFSMPLPSQLEHLQNPCRTQGTSPILPVLHSAPDVSGLRELSLELADSVQMVVQTLLQISPAQLLDPAKEHYSACSLSVPTSCMSAILTTMKNLNFVSANMSDLCVDAGNCYATVGNDSSCQTSSPTNVSDFDVGELLQGVGDALSGCAAQSGIDLVLFHADVGLRHVPVLGEELALSITLTHVIRQVMNTARVGDSVDVGLSIKSYSEDASESPTTENPQGNGGSPSSEDRHVVCAFEITHYFRQSEGGSDTPTPSNPNSPFFRPDPAFDSPFLQRLFVRTGASLSVGLPVRENLTGRAYEIAFRLQRGSSSAINSKTAPVSEYALPCGSRIAKEPTLEELTRFSETLRGNKAMLYASANSSFAHHLTSYLTAWGMDVSHLSLESEADGDENPSPSFNGLGTSANLHTKPKKWSLVDSPHTNEHSSLPPNGTTRSSPPVSFVLIDDDITILRERIQKYRAEQPPLFAVHPRKRPSLAAHHRPKSSPQVARAHGYGSTTPQGATGILVHFTSLANFKTVRDIIQCDLATHAPSLQPLEVMIIPKPAGPRRFLTALHSAMTKPLVDPLFTPIATSPMSPGLQGSPFFNLGQPSPKSPSSRPANSTRSNSERSVKTPREGASDPPGMHPPSPLAISDTTDYFPDSVKLGASAASGLVIPGPDGHPTGIVFQPRAKGKPVAPYPGEGQKAQFLVPTPDILRAPATRRSSHGEDRNAAQIPLSFAALHSSSVASGTLPIRQDSIPSTESPMQSTTVSKGKVRAQSVLADEITVASPGVSSRRGSPVESRKATASPPVSPSSAEPPSNAVPRRQPKRAALDQKPSTPPAVLNKGGKAVTDTNIIPPISVLIVDDNPINQTILSTFMRKKKIKYDVAKNGEEAVQKWRSGRFHLILMDIQMPVMDGIQATKEIRQLENLTAAAYTPSTPQSDGSVRTPSDGTSPESRPSASPYRSSVIIVALTASSLQSDRVAALAAGCNDFLTKPVSLQWLNNKIIEWGSIKALQMWADLRPEVAKTISTEQTAQAQMVAKRLHVPEGRITPIQSPSRSSSMGRPEMSGEVVVASPAAPLVEKLEALARRGEDSGNIALSSFSPSRGQNDKRAIDADGTSSALATTQRSDVEQSPSGVRMTADSGLVSRGAKERSARARSSSADDDLSSDSPDTDHVPRTP